MSKTIHIYGDYDLTVSINGARTTIPHGVDYTVSDAVYNLVMNNMVQDTPVYARAKSELPQVTEADAGKIMIVNASGEWETVGFVPLPNVTEENAGMILSVNADGEYEVIGFDPLPDVTAEDAGKVLTVDTEGAWGAAALPETEPSED